MLAENLFLFFVGILAGGMNAIAGGGMLLGFPMLLAYGVPPIVANASSAAIVLPGQISSAYGYRKYLRRTPKKYLWLLVPCFIGAPIGAYILHQTSPAAFEDYVPILILFAVGLFAFQPWLHAYLHKHLHARSRKVKPLVVMSFALLPVAIYGGYFGAGLGFIMLAFLGFTKIHDIHQMNAMKNVAAIVMCVGTLIVLAPSSLINWHVVLVMSVGTLIGGYAGAHLAQRVSSHAIRVTVITIGVITAVYLAIPRY